MERYKFKQPAISDTLADFFLYVKNLVLSQCVNRKKLSMFFKSSSMIHTFTEVKRMALTNSIMEKLV